MESDSFLVQRTGRICREQFKGREITNLLVVRWGKPWKSKLGHIKPLKRNPEYGSLIEINPVLLSPVVPGFVLDATILHELIHYFQGFGSNHPRQQRHPHRGGAITREFAKFGWGELHEKQEKWIRENWLRIWREFISNNKNKQKSR